MNIREEPTALEFESAILEAVLLNNEIIDTVNSLLKVDDFYSVAHQKTFKAMISLYNKNENIDTYMLTNELKQMGVFDEVGGTSYLMNLREAMPSSQNVESYCKVVKEKANTRKLIREMTDIVGACRDGKLEFNELVNLAQKSVYDISMSTEEKEFRKLSDGMKNTIDNLRQLEKNGNEFSGVATGFKGLDDKLGGFQKSDLILLAARPSMGKTALAINIAQNVAIKDKKKVAVFSLEMSEEQLFKRIISSEASINSIKLRNGNINMTEWGKITSIYNDVTSEDIQLFIDDTSSINVDTLRSKCRKMKSQYGLDLIVIDYLQLMTTSRKTNNENDRVADISKKLKAVAKEINCPVLALSQLSRAPESRPTNKRPVLSDLRDSGAIEQDADVVMMLYREKYYDEKSNDDSTEVIIAKHRNGETGTVKLEFIGEYTKFVDYEDYDGSQTVFKEPDWYSYDK